MTSTLLMSGSNPSIATAENEVGPTASDGAMAGDSAELTDTAYGQSGTFVFTASSTGTVMFTAKYRRISNTPIFNASSISVQVFG